MLRSLRCIAMVGLTAVMTTLSGCPVVAPDLSVTPLALNFGVNEDNKTIRIQNQGGGTLEWTATVSEGAPWLSLEAVTGTKQAQMVEGDTSTEVDTVRLLVDRAVLAESSSRNAAVVVTSNGGSQSIAVSVSDGGPATLGVSPTSLSFGSQVSTLDVTISNSGFEALSWSLAIPEDVPWLSATPRSNTSVRNGGADTVTFTVNRAGLPSGNYQTQVPVTSNGGNTQILVSMSVPPISVSTTLIDYGTINQPATRTFTVSNPSENVVGLQITTSAAWLTILNPITLLDPQDTELIQLAADPADLEPGLHTATVNVVAPGLGFSHVVTIRLTVPGIEVSPATLDFGEITAPQTRSLTLTNLTGGDLPFTVVIPSGHPWLAITPSSGIVTGSSRTLEVTATPSAAPAGSYEANVQVRFGDTASALSETVTISMSRPEPARLEASPKSIFFGTSLIERRIAIWNVGIGTVNWRIDTSGFPAWLELTPVSGAGIASGTVSGDTTDEVLLRIDRGQAPEGVFDLSHAFNITSTGDATNTVRIELNANIAQVPEFVLQADAIDERGIPTLVVPSAQSSRTFVVRNEGTGPLSWSFGTLPSWIASISPSQGTLNSNTQQTVTLTVNRGGVVAPGVQAELVISTNDPNNSNARFDVALIVAPTIVIGTEQASGVAIGPKGSSASLRIANYGDRGTVLNYQVVTNQSWLSISPATGVSEGTSSALKDFQEHSVTVDRSRLNGESSSARIVISAILIQNGVAVPDPSIAPVEVTVTVEAAPLTIQSALPRTRVPSLVRNVLMMRNIRSESIPIPDSRLQDIGNLFRIKEIEIPLELSETNQFLKKDYSANVLVLLDFSGSMLSAAQTVVADGQLGDPGDLTEDALKSVYLQCIPDLLAELPAHYRVGLGVFNDHALPETGVVRMITGDGEPTFTRDKALLAARIASVQVNDNGATDLIPALESGAEILVRQDLNDNLRPFDDADVKAMLVFTDGRDTSLSRISETANLIVAQKVRVFLVGWGERVQADPLIQLGAATGGHYYSTESRPTGQVDPFGVPVRIPLVSALSDWCSLDPGDPCDESIPNDLNSQVVLSYTTLNFQPSVVVAADLTFNDPNDQNSVCLPEQGEITAGVEYRQQDFSTIQGDVRMGQISLRTEGISGGEATVIARADYMPRNITQIGMSISVTSLESPAVTVSRVAQVNGGLASNWNLVEGPIGTYTLSSPDGAPFRFSDFGDLLAIRVTNVTQPFTLNFEVTSPTYVASNFETKYFTHPDSIQVGGGPFLATSFPAAFFDSRPAPLDLDSEFVVVADNDTDQVEIDVYNLGGSHVAPGSVPDPITGEFNPAGPVNVGLFWEASIASESNFLSFEENTQETGFVTSTFTPSTMFINLDRASVPPGPREGQVVLTYGSGAVNVSGTLDPLIIRYNITNPEFLITSRDNETGLQIPVDFISFGFTPDSQEIRVRNTGQSTLAWRVNAGAFPTWLELSDIVGTAGPDQESPVTINIIREFVPEGEHEFDIVFSASFTAPITLTVAVEGLPDP